MGVALIEDTSLQIGFFFLLLSTLGVSLAQRQFLSLFFSLKVPGLYSYCECKTPSHVREDLGDADAQWRHFYSPTTSQGIAFPAACGNVWLFFQAHHFKNLSSRPLSESLSLRVSVPSSQFSALSSVLEQLLNPKPLVY